LWSAARHVDGFFWPETTCTQTYSCLCVRLYIYIYIYIHMYMRKNVAERVGIAVTLLNRIRKDIGHRLFCLTFLVTFLSPSTQMSCSRSCRQQQISPESFHFFVRLSSYRSAPRNVTAITYSVANWHTQTEDCQKVKELKFLSLKFSSQRLWKELPHAVWYRRIFSFYIVLPAALYPGVYSASNRNEYQKQKNNVSEE
jgi:hypothetical protein